jgi:hypothetical protein
MNEDPELLTIIEKYENMLFASGEMTKPPCFRCGYSGPGYFQEKTHPCAKYHHFLYEDADID